jgi:hypothetical protein
VGAVSQSVSQLLRDCQPLTCCVVQELSPCLDVPCAHVVVAAEIKGKVSEDGTGAWGLICALVFTPLSRQWLLGL